MLRILALAAALASGCGSRCAEVAHARDALAKHGVAERAPDLEVVVGLAPANGLIAQLLAQQPIAIPLDVPDLGPVQITTPLTAKAIAVELQPGSPGRVRFAARIEVDDAGGEVTTLRTVAEIVPAVTDTELVIGLDAQNVLHLEPELSTDDRAKLGRAVTRWLPAKLKAKVPPQLLDAAAQKLGDHLTGDAWKVVQRALLVRLGELTTARLRLPDAPVTKLDIRSQPGALVVAITTSLPVRAGLVGATTDAPPSLMTVRVAGSAAAELANWALDKQYLPPWYTRSLAPSKTGEYRPRFDYVPGGHPLKVYAFQERGGCSYFKVGVAAKVALDGDKLVVTATDRDLEAQAANPAIEAGAWVKFFLTGWVDRSKRVAAHTQLTIGGRTLETRVTSAALAHDELEFGLAAAPPNAPSGTSANGSAMSRPSDGSSGGIANSSR